MDGFFLLFMANQFTNPNKKAYKKFISYTSYKKIFLN